MRLALDCRSYFMRTGIARFTRGLAGAILQDGGPDLLLLISNHHHPDEIGGAGPRAEIVPSAAPWLGGATERDALESEVAAWGADVFHAVFPPHALDATPTLTTVFDLSPLSHPDLHQAPLRDAFAEAWATARSRAAAFLTVSAATARRIREMKGRGAAVHTVPCGLSPPFDRTAPTGADGDRSGVLAVGTIEPRKNVHVVLEAARRIARDGHDISFTLVGKRGWGYERFEDDLARTPNARWLGYVDDERLLSLYRRSAIVVFPSALEGFGLPVLEAMAQGALPLVSEDEALGEVVGMADLQVPPYPEAVASAVLRWTTDREERKVRTELLQQRARFYTWQSAASACLRIYEAIG